jgi:hypothetical protein
MSRHARPGVRWPLLGLIPICEMLIPGEPALPEGVERRLSLVANTIVRVSNDKTETVLFPEPTFSTLRISGDRKRITFDVCLDPPSQT